MQRALQRLAQQALASPSISALLRDITQVLGDSLMAQSYRCWQVLSDRHTLQQVTAIGPWENHSHSHSHSHSQIPGQRSGKRPGQGSRDRLGASPWPVAATQTNHCSGRRSMVLPSQLKLQEHPWLAPLLALDQPLRFRSDSLSPSTVSWIGKLLPTDCCLEGGFCEGALLPIRGLAQEPLALVELYRPGPAFGLDDLTFLQSAADLLATAIQRARSEALLETQSLVLEQLAGGAVITDVLNSLCRLIEEHSPGGLCSIQLLDSSGRKMLATAAPNFPPEWKQAINGLEIGEGVASCGTALFRREPVLSMTLPTIRSGSRSKPLRLSMVSTPAGRCRFFPRLGRFWVVLPYPIARAVRLCPTTTNC
ncbi:MAG: GAF domain-containing protein [Synechococcales cyanobacterium RM1_1_8]|nr:GAF domain-containing protein [Synechococcales cyanobacterium RM1_1_8]